MNTATLEQAHNTVRDYLKRNAEGLAGMDVRPFMALSLALKSGFKLVSTDETPKSYQEAKEKEATGKNQRAMLTPENVSEIDSLAEQATSNPTAWDACAMVIKELAENKILIPASLGRLASSVMCGETIQPKQAGRKSMQNVTRDFVICMAIFHAREIGLYETRNDASPPHSACDVVSEALREHGIFLDYQSVKTIWKNRNLTD